MLKQVQSTQAACVNTFQGTSTFDANLPASVYVEHPVLMTGSSSGCESLYESQCEGGVFDNGDLSQGAHLQSTSPSTMSGPAGSVDAARLCTQQNSYECGGDVAVGTAADAPLSVPVAPLLLQPSIGQAQGAGDGVKDESMLFDLD